MYELEIETENRLRKIQNPRKARDIDLGILSIIQVMDGDGKWHFVGFTIFWEDAQNATEEINCAIENKESTVLVDYIS